MKKILFTVLVALTTMTVANAQSIKDDIQASEKRAAELQMQMNNQPKACGVANIDNFATAINEAAKLAIINSKTLGTFYYRQIGETKDGITDVTVKKPTLEEWKNLGEGIFGESSMLKTAKDNAENAAKELQKLTDDAKNGNPLAKAKKAKQLAASSAVVAYGKDALPILVEETAAQANAIKQIIDTLTSGKNL